MLQDVNEFKCHVMARQLKLSIATTAALVGVLAGSGQCLCHRLYEQMSRETVVKASGKAQ